jgi:hypothetical protein
MLWLLWLLKLKGRWRTGAENAIASTGIAEGVVDVIATVNVAASIAASSSRRRRRRRSSGTSAADAATVLADGATYAIIIRHHFP